MTPHLRWSTGGEAELLALDDDRVRLRSTAPSAPGSRPAGSLADGREVRVKVHRCKRIEEGAQVFEIEGRLIDATREVRAALAALLGSSHSAE